MPVPAAPRGSQAAPAKVALVGGTQYFFPNSLSICSLFSQVKGGRVHTPGPKETPLAPGHALLPQSAQRPTYGATGIFLQLGRFYFCQFLCSRQHTE